MKTSSGLYRPDIIHYKRSGRVSLPVKASLSEALNLAHALIHHDPFGSSRQLKAALSRARIEDGFTDVRADVLPNQDVLDREFEHQETLRQMDLASHLLNCGIRPMSSQFPGAGSDEDDQRLPDPNTQQLKDYGDEIYRSMK